jgi:hypothetical protein
LSFSAVIVVVSVSVIVIVINFVIIIIILIINIIIIIHIIIVIIGIRFDPPWFVLENVSIYLPSYPWSMTPLSWDSCVCLPSPFLLLHIQRRKSFQANLSYCLETISG